MMDSNTQVGHQRLEEEVLLLVGAIFMWCVTKDMACSWEFVCFIHNCMNQNGREP